MKGTILEATRNFSSTKMILFNDFKKEYAYLINEVTPAINRVLDSGWYILGKEVQQFEDSFAEYIGSKYTIGVANGLDALKISLMALDIKEGDEVITTAHTAVATALAITEVGATPVFADIDDYYHISAESIAEKITTKTKAVIPVHLYGQSADMKEITDLCIQHKLHVIEDSCQAHGATFNNKKVGTFGELGCFSFYPTKNLGAYGDGGAITTDDEELYEKCKSLRNYGQINRYEHKFKGINSRLDELQAAVLNIKLAHLDEFNNKRIVFGKLYNELLRGIPWLEIPLERAGARHVYHLYVIKLAEHIDREKLKNYLQEKEIASLVHYPIPVHKQPAYAEYNNITLQKTEEAANRILSLPIHPFLEKEEIEYICKGLQEFKA
jgi:dTDP-4-amino-4,6-dideoxygalactose transaminase